MKKIKKSKSQISKLTNLPLPWPGIRLSCLNDRKTRQEKIAELKTFIDSQVDYFTGLLWDTGAQVNFLTRFCSLVNYAIDQSMTSLVRDPFWRALSRWYKSDPEPEIFDFADVQFFLTYLWHWEPLLYVAFVLGTWAGLRSAELKRLTYGMLSPKQLATGEIILERNMTKKKRQRIIRETDIPHVFVLLSLLPPGWLAGDPDKLIFAGCDIEGGLFRAWRALMGKAWPFNGMRHMAASCLLVYSNPTRPEKLIIETCKRVLGHKFGNNETLFEHYFKLVLLEQAKWFYTMRPEVLTPMLRATYLWRFYTGWIEVTLNTRMWPNHAMHCRHNLRTNGSLVIEELRTKRPIFATAIGNILRVETIWPDGTKTTKDIKKIKYQTAFYAEELQHRWRVAVYTGQGVLDYETGEVHHYERNFGPLWKQTLYTLHNPEEIEKAILEQQKLTPPPAPAPGLPPPAQRECTGLLPVAVKVGCATDLLTSYMRLEPQTKSDFSPYIGREAIPERFKVILARLFPKLVFTPTVVTHRDLKRLCTGVYPYCLTIGGTGKVTKKARGTATTTPITPV